MRTIGIDIRLIGKGRTGDEAVFLSLTKAVLHLDQELHFLLFTDEQEPTRLATISAKLGAVGNSRVTLVPLLGKNRFLWNALTLPWYLFRHHVDVYHTQYIAPLFLPKRTRLITHIHDVSFQAHPEWIGFLDRFFLRMLIPRSLRASWRILTPSFFTRSEIMKHYAISEEKIVVVPNASGELWEQPMSDEVQLQVKKKYALESPYFISVGTMQPRKNIFRLIQAFDHFSKKHPEVKLVLVGNPLGHHVDSSVQSFARTSPDKVFFPGYVKDAELKALVGGSLALVLPSLYEGFGIPLLEAYRVDVPAIASDIEPFHEVAGEAALFIDPLSLESIEKALYTLFIDQKLRRVLVEKGRARKDEFSWDKSAQVLLECYRYLIDRYVIF